MTVIKNLVISVKNAPGKITSSFGGAMSLPRLLHCPVFLPKLTWELLLVGNQCDNTWSKLQIFKLTSFSLFSS